MTPSQIIFLMLGLIIVCIDSYGIWKPKAWVEWVERQFVYHRERIVTGILCVLLGLVSFFFLPGGWRSILMTLVGVIFLIIGALMLGLPNVLRQILISFGEINDNVLRGLFIADAAFGVFLIVLAFI